MVHIFYAEDDLSIGQAVKEYLEQRGCYVSLFPTVEDMKKAVKTKLPDLTLIDWNLPDGQGDGLCRWIRRGWPKLPIIFLTVRGEAKDVVAGFQNGADDYVVKPFELEVLYSRIVALLRRTGGMESGRYSCDEIFLDTERKQVRCKEEEILLSQPEYEILLILLRNKGKTVTRAQLISQVWDSRGSFVNDNTLTVAMKRLREKLHHPACLRTVRSFGYRMEERV